ncbi:DUF3769 domain-containing protein [Prochlorococcus sp. MIT 1223]|uniref:DUF3769 domain-containing protein n=1 Tax=Prochlorococcus sp. MIT 1223 TaxID=3096217 RepID=UPI002A748638|nr:DUF3769 domain-containing protein [Prochlorococcus sp. MIT 1223]
MFSETLDCKKVFGIFALGVLCVTPIEALGAFKNNSDNSNNIEELSFQIGKEKIPLELNLYADRQYDLNEKVFVAEGNVKAILNGAILASDRIEYDRQKKILVATGNVVFKKGSQYFQASSLNYDFIREVGEVNDVYGLLSIESISNDINLIKSEKALVLAEDQIRVSPIKNIILKDGYIIKGGSIDSELGLSANSTDKDGVINNWRIQSPRIIIRKNGWSADKISFTNDPLNPTQARIEAQDVEAKEDNNSTLISCSKSRLIIEEKFSIPLLKNRKLGKSEAVKWFIGLDYKEKDGLFLGRKISPLDIGKDFKLYFQPQFLLQRALKGKTNNYIENGAGPLSDKISTETNFADLFGLNVALEGKKSNWDINLSSEITTFDSQRFSNGYRYNGTLSRDLKIYNIDKVNTSFFTSYRDKVWNGSLGDSDIYFASGVQLNKHGEFKFNQISHRYNMSLGSGHYEGEDYYENNKLIELWKTNIFASLDSSFPIYRNKKDEISGILKYRYSPNVIQPGLDFNTKISTSYSFYGNSTNQALINFDLGPEITFGTYTKSFLDYTRFSVMPGITIKDGSSPFRFDNNVDLRTISLELDQQIYGPLLFASKLEYNIDKRSNHYGKSIKSQVATIIQRRAYGFGLFYQPYQKAGGIMFRLNGFDFSETGEPLLTN